MCGELGDANNATRGTDCNLCHRDLTYKFEAVGSRIRTKSHRNARRKALTPKCVKAACDFLVHCITDLSAKYFKTIIPDRYSKHVQCMLHTFIQC